MYSSHPNSTLERERQGQHRISDQRGKMKVHRPHLSSSSVIHGKDTRYRQEPCGWKPSPQDHSWTQSPQGYRWVPRLVSLVNRPSLPVVHRYLKHWLIRLFDSLAQWFGALSRSHSAVFQLWRRSPCTRRSKWTPLKLAGTDQLYTRLYSQL